MPKFPNLSDLQNNNKLPRISLMLRPILGAGSPTSESSGMSSLASSFSEPDHLSTTTSSEIWAHLNKTSTPRTTNMKNLRQEVRKITRRPNTLAVKLQYSIDLNSSDIVHDNKISYHGRDILDLGSNIVPYSWQQKTPLMELDHPASDKVDEKCQNIPMKYCAKCGFCQPQAPV